MSSSRPPKTPPGGSTTVRSRRSTRFRLVALAAAMVGSSAAVAPPPDAGADTGEQCDEVVDAPVAGSEAVAALGPDLPDVARAHGRSARELRETLASDDALHVSVCGQLAYLDDRDHLVAEAEWIPWTYWDDWDAQEALSASAGVDVFALNTDPGADRTIHLDFTGGISTAAWASLLGVPGGTPLTGFDADGDPSSYSALERAAIYDIWSRVAEDFAPFVVNVTTEDPGVDALVRSNAADQRYGTRHLILNEPPFAGLGGVAWVDTFGRSSLAAHYVLQGGFTFADGGSRRLSPHQIASIASHEVGHNLNLDHHGLWGVSAYHPGNPIWTPLMGNGGSPISHWSDGAYPGATRPDQDDIHIMGAHLPSRADDHGDTPATATRLQADRRVSGIIGDRDDRDVFTASMKDPIRVEVAAAPFGPNLDILVTVLDATGEATVATLDPPVSVTSSLLRPFGLDVEQVLELPPGTYQFVVEGTGFGDPAAGFVTGFSDYGSLGGYSIEVSRACGSAKGPSSCNQGKPKGR